MFNSSGIFSVKERISNRLQWFSLTQPCASVGLSLLKCMFLSILPWIHAGTDVCQYYECKRQILIIIQPSAHWGHRATPKASAYIKINHQALSCTSLAWLLRTETRQKAKGTRKDTGSDVETAAVTGTVAKKNTLIRFGFKKELSHKSFSFPPFQVLINHPFTVLQSSWIWVGIQQRPNLG